MTDPQSTGGPAQDDGQPAPSMDMNLFRSMLIDSVGFDEFVMPGQFFAPTVAYGNNSANRIQPIDINDLGGTGTGLLIVRPE